ncbi:MAG: endonuclease/exonuclease/phosphatase family protein [Nitrososphaera sp.]
MFDRPAVMNRPSWDDGKDVLKDYADLTNLVEKKEYSPSDKAKMLTIMKRRGLLDGQSEYIRLREIRGKLVKRPKSGSAQIVADGRDDWIGWFELKKEHVKETAIENTARVIKAVNADVLCIVEAESRTALNRFNDSVIAKIKGERYEHVMLIDGNDDRGIDVGIMTRQGFPVEGIRSHVDDELDGKKIFSRDCAEFEIRTPSGNRLLVLVNHFKSKGYGSLGASNAKRKIQAQRVRAIYQQRLSDGFQFIAIAGDLNDSPGSAPLQPLVGNNSKLIDIMVHDAYAGDGRPGTWETGTTIKKKLDYILMSEELAQMVQHGGIERRGIWMGKHSKLPRFQQVNGENDAASDHAALWVDLNL